MVPTYATRAVLFVDVSNSTGLYESLGDLRALARVGHCLAMVGHVCEEFGGRVVKTMGDGAMCVFVSAEAAVRASRLMQEKSAEQQDPGEPALGIHIGCHYGPVLENAGDVYGDTVNLAARIAGLAKVGQIIITAEMTETLPPELAGRVRKLHPVPVRGRQEPAAICELLWRDADDLAQLRTGTDHGQVARLVLRYEGREWRFEGPGGLTLGRGGGCDIVVADPKASRQHARIERRRNNYVLADHSSNGTWVHLTGEPQGIVLRRKELILRVSGLICFGHVLIEEEGAPVEFWCAE
jgi:class 3 adenylate cyclase